MRSITGVIKASSDAIILRCYTYSRESAGARTESISHSSYISSFVTLHPTILAVAMLRFLISASLFASSAAFVLNAAPPSRHGVAKIGAYRSVASVSMVDATTLMEVAVYDSAMEAQANELKAEIESLKQALEAKGDEVKKFADSVEGELQNARKTAEAGANKVVELEAQLKERTDEVDLLNTHLEAHSATTKRLNDEVAELKTQVAAAESKAADAESRADAAEKKAKAAAAEA